MGAFGLLLAGVGIYGVAAFAASRRAREVGIRMALGATERDVSRLLVRSGVRAPLLGLVAGLAAGVLLSIGASNVIPGVRIADPIALVSVAMAVGLLTVVALTVPARALLRGGPMGRLRDE